MNKYEREKINGINNGIWKSEEKSFHFSAFPPNHVGFDLFCDKNKKFSSFFSQFSSALAQRLLPNMLEIVTNRTIVFVFNIPAHIRFQPKIASFLLRDIDMTKKREILCVQKENLA